MFGIGGASDSLDRFTYASIIDVLAIAVVIYLALLLIKVTTAMSLLRGIIIVVIGAVLLTQALTQSEIGQRKATVP